MGTQIKSRKVQYIHKNLNPKCQTKRKQDIKRQNTFQLIYNMNHCNTTRAFVLTHNALGKLLIIKQFRNSHFFFIKIKNIIVTE